MGFLYLHIIFKVRCLYAFIFHKRWIIAGLILLFFTANKLNGDSLAVYDQIIQPNQGNQLVEPVFGEARYIRSDEFVVDTPSRLASGYGENPYSQYNYIQRGTATLNAVNGIYLGYSTVGKSPFQFVYLFLDRDYAFSFCWYAPIILTFMTAIELCLIISRGKRLLSFTGACLIGLSSFYLWWGFPAFLLGAQGSIVCGYYFINKRKIIQKILFALGLGIAFAFFVLTLYPAWIVAMGYVAIIMVVWILHENWKQVKQFKVLDYILLLGAAVFAGSLIFSYLKVNNEYITAIMNTSYPGQRIENGGFSLPRIFTYYQSYMYGIKDIGNSSEASSFFSFFPIPFIMSVYQWIKTKCKDWFLAGMLGISVVYIIYCTVGIPEAMARVTMLSYCTPTRMIPILGLVEIFLLIRCLSIEGKEQKKYPFWMAILIGGVTTIICSIVSHNSYPGYVTGGWIVISVAIVFIIGVAIQIVRKQKEKRLLEFGLIGISLVTAFTIRPISIGLDAIFSKPVASEIQKICEEENTKWIVRSDDFKVSGFLVACGAPTINSVNTYPNMELWKTLDPDDEYEDIYNRYAHVIVDFVQEKTSFELLYEDSIKINLSYDDLEKTGD